MQELTSGSHGRNQKGIKIMEKKYYIIENQHRPDGQINNTVTTRQTFASALSYYHERISKMVMTDLYTQVAVMLVDENLNVINHEVVETLYQQAYSSK